MKSWCVSWILYKISFYWFVAFIIVFVHYPSFMNHFSSEMLLLWNSVFMLNTLCCHIPLTLSLLFRIWTRQLTLMSQETPRTIRTHTWRWWNVKIKCGSLITLSTFTKYICNRHLKLARDGKVWAVFVSSDYHFNDVIMDAMASQITSLTIVYSTVYSVEDQRKHQSSASLAFVWGFHRRQVNPPHKGPVTREMFPFDDVIMWQICVLTFAVWYITSF